MSTKKLRVEITQSPIAPEVMIIRIEGELDSASIDRIGPCFDTIIGQGKNFAIVDFTSVSSISSATLGELMGGRKRLIEKGGDLVFAGMPLEIRTKLNLMGANKIFRLFSDLRTAINAYKWEFQNISETIRVSFPSSLKLVPPVRQLVSRIARQKGYGNRDSFRIETIVDEVCNNAVEHGKRGFGHKIDLDIVVGKDKIELNVVNVSDPDKVASLKTLLAPQGESETRSADVKRGRGLSLIKMLSNDMSVDFSDNGTSVHVTKLREE